MDKDARAGHTHVAEPHRAARAVLALSATVSLALMFYMGRRQQSVVLIVLFTGWVASPFVALAVVDAWASPWPAAARRVVRRVMLMAGLGSLAVYGLNAVAPFSARPAAIFLIVPAATWVLGVVVLAACARRPR